MKLSSDPPLPEDEVLSRLLFGKDARQLSPAESVQLAAAVAQLSGHGGPSMAPLGWLRRTFRVDTLDVVSGETAGAGSALRVGKYLTENVFVSVDQGLTGQASKAGVSVEVTRGLSLESHLGSDQEGSLGLSWKWNIKGGLALGIAKLPRHGGARGFSKRNARHPSVFITRPISLTFVIATILIVLTMAVPAVRKRQSKIIG